MENIYDIVVVGAGPAGMTAAIYGARAGKKTVMIEKDMYGGNIVNAHALENYPAIRTITGAEFAKDMYEHAMDLGAEFRWGAVTAVDLEDEEQRIFSAMLDDGSKIYGRTVIIATGVKNAMGIDREEEMTGKGLSYCATCDGMFFREKQVVLLGGGNGAIKDAEYLANGCSKVYVAADKFTAADILMDRISKRDNVELLEGWKAEELEGDNMIAGVKLINESGQEKIIDASGVFVSLGQVPQTNRFSEFLSLDEKGFADAPEDCKTLVPGVFIAGDCRKKNLRQVVTATADGAVAASGALSYLNGRK